MMKRTRYKKLSDKKKGIMISNLVKEVGDKARAEVIASTTRLYDIEKLRQHRASGLLSIDVGKQLGIRKDKVLEYGEESLE